MTIVNHIMSHKLNYSFYLLMIALCVVELIYAEACFKEQHQACQNAGSAGEVFNVIGMVTIVPIFFIGNLLLVMREATQQNK